MTTLRSLLEEYGDTVPTEVPATRIPSVHRRIRTARRRRTAGGVAVVVAVLVAGTLGITLPHDTAPTPADAPAQLAGRTVPPTTSSWGATYAYVKGFVGHGHLSVTLPRNEELLVRAGSAKDGGRLVLRADGPDWVVPGGDFGAFKRIESSHLTVTVDSRGDTGRIALAVYALSKSAPGFTRDGITFPASVANRPLLGAFIGDPGQDSGTAPLDQVRAMGRRPTVEVHPLCVGAPAGAMVSVDLGDGPFEMSCQQGPARTDSGHAGPSETARAPQGALSATVRLVDRHGEPLAVPAGARIGAAVYGPDPQGARMAGLPPAVDQDGHTWRLTDSTRITTSVNARHTVLVDASTPVLVAYGTKQKAAGGRVVAEIQGYEPLENSGGGIGYAELSTGDPNDSIALGGRGLPEGAELVVGVYELAD